LRKNKQLIEKKPGPDTSSVPGFLRRMAAVFYDAMLLLAVLFFATALILPFNKGEAFSANQLFYPAYLLFVSFVFYGWFWTHGGQTLGLRAWQLRLSSEDEQAVSWSRAALRFLCAILSWACFGLGFIRCLFDKNGQAWHDSLSKTRLSQLPRK